MHYSIKRKNLLSQFIQLQLQLTCSEGEVIHLQLPAWRPGRYELANYAQKVRGLKVYKNSGEIAFTKNSKDLWVFTAPEAGKYCIEYDFHANHMDAGGSWSDDEQLYLNFINFVFEVKGRENETITITLDLPEDFRVGTALPETSTFSFQAMDFQHLVDSPLMASATLRLEKYSVGDADFHLWFQGEVHFDMEKLLQDFSAFTEKQVEAFGGFPARAYHFLFQLLPYKHYHGVEHQFSTVITIGPAEELKDKKFMDELFGVSSHELYHFWNVCRIRPQELLPYDFSKEAYIQTGVVAEGVTTYMGDLFLLKSGYFSLEEYLKILEKQLDREFESFGWQNQSIVDSSIDLWLDGYKAGIPDKKVSIYNRGALIALTLDLMLLESDSSLQEVMMDMWGKFGNLKKGYLLEDYQQCVAAQLGEELTQDFFRQFIQGTEDILPLLEQQLDTIDITAQTQPRDSFFAAKLGLILNDQGVVTKIHPDSSAFGKCMLQDRILENDGKAFRNDYRGKNGSTILRVERYGRRLNVELAVTDSDYYRSFKLKAGEANEKRTKWSS